ncbi:MAG: hypothetical protein AAB874_00840 [Patescibacteria group bacterium]
MIGKIFGILCTAAFFAIFFSMALAQEATPLHSSNAFQPVNYALPYPGILPGHPLYFIKRFRDLLLSLLISNPVRKVEFYILMADKHLSTGVVLKEKGEIELAFKSWQDSVNYLTKGKAILFTSKSKFDNNLKDRYKRAVIGHQEVLKLQVGEEASVYKQIQDLAKDFPE